MHCSMHGCKPSNLICGSVRHLKCDDVVQKCKMGQLSVSGLAAERGLKSAISPSLSGSVIII